MNLLEVGQTVLSQVQKGTGKAQAEVFLVDSESRSSDWSENAPENRVSARSRGLGLRLIREGRLGFGYTNRWDTEAVGNLIRQALASSDSTTPDPLQDMLEPVPPASAKGLDLVDKTLAETPWEDRVKFLESLDGQVKKREPRISKLLRGSYREGRAQVAVVNSKGVAAVQEGTSAGFSLACVAVENGETQIGYGFQGVRHHADLKPDWVIERAIEHTMSLLGAKQIPSRAVTIWCSTPLSPLRCWNCSRVRCERIRCRRGNHS